MVSEEYLEAVLTARKPGQLDRAEHWLGAHGLRFVPLRTGLLVQGDRQTFDAAFGIDLQRATLPMSLPIPPELQDLVASITIPAPRRYHGVLSSPHNNTGLRP